MYPDTHGPGQPVIPAERLVLLSSGLERGHPSEGYCPETRWRVRRCIAASRRRRWEDSLRRADRWQQRQQREQREDKDRQTRKPGQARHLLQERRRSDAGGEL